MRALIPLTEELSYIAARCLSDVSKEEISAARIDDVYTAIRVMAGAGTRYAMFSDNRFMAIAGSRPESMARVTWCLALHPFTPTTARLIGAWSRIERKFFPNDMFQAVSYSQHPMRDRFFKFLGMEKSMEIKGANVYVLPPLQVDKALQIH